MSMFSRVRSAWFGTSSSSSSPDRTGPAQQQPAPEDALADAPTNTAPVSDAVPDFSIDEYRQLKVIVIGAGFSGIAAGIRFRQRIPNLQLVIYEQNEGVGGTWWSNKYPGLTCDIPSHCYQYTFAQKTDWSAYYAPQREILGYIESVVDTYKLAPYIRLQHEMVGARYDEPTGKWHVRVRRPVSPASTTTSGPAAEFEEFEDTADLLFTGVGGLSRWKWPEIDGLKSFKGTLVHSANWEIPHSGEDGAAGEGGQLSQGWEDDVKDWGDKHVAVVGVGSSAIQIVPALQPRVKKLYNYVRGKTWLAVPFASGKMADLLHRNTGSDNFVFSEEEKRAFQADPEYYEEFRHELESDLNSVHLSTLRGTAMQEGGRAAFKDSMLQRLAKKPWIADHLIPDFGVACRRLTPGPGYLEALCEDNVDFVPTHIRRITETGIETVDGQHVELDVIICATGYDTTYSYPFPIIGRNGIDIHSKWSPHPVTYLGICVDGFPNLFFALGPNSGIGSGSLLAIIEQQVEYAVQVGMKMQRERLKSVEAKPEAVRDFDRYLENHFPKTVYSERCRSWYKMGKEEGRIVGLWPGSCLHALRSLKYPRWEDYNYERVDEGSNSHRFLWLGDGMTYNEKTMSGDRAWYLHPSWVDPPPIPTDANN